MQEYCYDMQFYKVSGPAIFFFGGEISGEGDYEMRTDMEWYVVGKQQNAALFLLEHRFYGDSWPTK